MAVEITSYTPDVIMLLKAAQNISNLYNHPGAGIEHLGLAFVEGSGIEPTATIIQQLSGRTLTDCNADLMTMYLHRSRAQEAGVGALPSLRKVITDAIEIAEIKGSSNVTSVDVLTALVAGETVTAQVFRQLGITPGKIKGVTSAPTTPQYFTLPVDNRVQIS